MKQATVSSDRGVSTLAEQAASTLGPTTDKHLVHEERDHATLRTAQRLRASGIVRRAFADIQQMGRVMI